MNEETKLPFGKKILVGNFTVLKYTRTLPKKQLQQLRDSENIHPDVRKKLTRSGLPYIKVEAVSQIWAIEFCCNTAVFSYLDNYLPLALAAVEAGVELKENSLTDIMHVFGMWMTDTCVWGDSQYIEAKANAVNDLMNRQRAIKANAESAEEKEADDKVLEEVKDSEDAKAAIIEMAQHAKEGGDDGSK